jgi:hypothetical protein
MDFCPIPGQTNKSFPCSQCGVHGHQAGFVWAAAVITESTGSAAPPGEHQSRIAPQFQHGLAASKPAIIGVIQKIHSKALDSILSIVQNKQGLKRL